MAFGGGDFDFFFPEVHLLIKLIRSFLGSFRSVTDEQDDDALGAFITNGLPLLLLLLLVLLKPLEMLLPVNPLSDKDPNEADEADDDDPVKVRVAATLGLCH